MLPNPCKIYCYYVIIVILNVFISILRKITTSFVSNFSNFSARAEDKENIKYFAIKNRFIKKKLGEN